MITGRIFELARSQPESTAIVWNDVTYNYATFSRAIAATRNYLETQTVPRSGISLVVSKSILDCWVIILALRDIGVDTISVLSLAQAETLELLQAECIVLAPGADKEYKGGAASIGPDRVILVPEDIYKNIHFGNIPSVQYPLYFRYDWRTEESCHGGRERRKEKSVNSKVVFI